MARFEGYISKHRTGTTFVALLAIALILLSVSARHVDIRPKQVGLAVFSVFERAATDTGSFFGRTVDSIGELKRLRARYDALRAQFDQLETVERNIVELRQENVLLRKQLGFSATIPFKHIAAQVIGKDPSNLFSGIVIDKGTRQGVKADMPVVAYQNGFQGLVGKILVTSPDTSIVQPIIDPNCYVAARLLTSRYEGLVSGAGSGRDLVTMSYVQKRARDQIKYGDLVITSGMSSIYPEGIYIGRVSSIGAKEWKPTLDLSIEPIVNFATLEYVFVLTKAQS